MYTLIKRWSFLWLFLTVTFNYYFNISLTSSYNRLVQFFLMAHPDGHQIIVVKTSPYDDQKKLQNWVYSVKHCAKFHIYGIYNGNSLSPVRPLDQVYYSTSFAPCTTIYITFYHNTRRQQKLFYVLLDHMYSIISETIR